MSGFPRWIRRDVATDVRGLASVDALMRMVTRVSPCRSVTQRAAGALPDGAAGGGGSQCDVRTVSRMKRNGT
jgi:hypothetical protein